MAGTASGRDPGAHRENATERGRDGYDKYRREFSKLIWQLASPKWKFDDATFDRTAASFDNPDHVAIVNQGRVVSYGPADQKYLHRFV